VDRVIDTGKLVVSVDGLGATGAVAIVWGLTWTLASAAPGRSVSRVLVPRSLPEVIDVVAEDTLGGITAGSGKRREIGLAIPDVSSDL